MPGNLSQTQKENWNNEFGFIFFQTMLKAIRVIIISLVTVFIFTNILEAAGLSTDFSEVTLENLETGKAYSTKERVNLPLVVVNSGKYPIDLNIDILLPESSELKEGYEPIPSLSWIKLEKSNFKEIKPDDSASTDVIITIPDDKNYRGKKYQVFIWTHSAGKLISVGLKSKLLLKIRGE